MEFEKIQNKGQARIFNNQFLEYLTKTHPLVIWTMYFPIIFFLPYYAIYQLKIETSITIAFYCIGLFIWTFTEYMLHRFVFHYHPKTAIGKKVNYTLHGNHHEYPRDKERLFMPPIPSIIIASLFFFVFFSVFNIYAIVLFPGFILGYLIYGTMHYAIHAYNPPFKWMKGLWRNHHLHHYKHADSGFGVSSTLWDHIFGTMFELKKEKKKVLEN